MGSPPLRPPTTFDKYGRVFQQFDASGDNHGLRYVYNNQGYLKQLQEVDYIFDVLGNLTQRQDRSAGQDLLEDFTYDSLNRLSGVDLTAPLTAPLQKTWNQKTEKTWTPIVHSSRKQKTWTPIVEKTWTPIVHSTKKHGHPSFIPAEYVEFFEKLEFTRRLAILFARSRQKRRVFNWIRMKK